MLIVFWTDCQQCSRTVSDKVWIWKFPSVVRIDCIFQFLKYCCHCVTRDILKRHSGEILNTSRLNETDQLKDNTYYIRNFLSAWMVIEASGTAKFQMLSLNPKCQIFADGIASFVSQSFWRTVLLTHSLQTAAQCIHVEIVRPTSVLPATRMALPLYIWPPSTIM